MHTISTHAFPKSLLAGLILALLSMTAAAAEPTIHDIYTLANSGRLQEAQQQMQQVLHDHPNSGRAHFVEAELLARQNQLSAARGEFATAERLSPGLTFESPQAVQNLRARLFSSNAPRVQHYVTTSAPSRSIAGPLIIGGLLLIILVMVIRAMTRRAQNPAMMPPSAMPQNPSAFGSGYGPGYGPGMQSGGMGSGLMGSLVTGAALGAGLVAGEAVAHKLMDGNDSSQGFVPPPQDNNLPDNLGGDDFGMSDASSWDSGDSGGGDGGGWD